MFFFLPYVGVNIEGQIRHFFTGLQKHTQQEIEKGEKLIQILKVEVKQDSIKLEKQDLFL